MSRPSCSSRSRHAHREYRACRAAGALAALAAFAICASGCAARDRVQSALDRGVVQPGLANGPKLGGDTPTVSRDAVANAADSCPSDPSRGDPLPHRFPACAGAPERGAVSLTSATLFVPPKPALNRWKFHLEGLPPCEDPISPWVTGTRTPESGPLCAR